MTIITFAELKTITTPVSPLTENPKSHLNTEIAHLNIEFAHFMKYLFCLPPPVCYGGPAKGGSEMDIVRLIQDEIEYEKNLLSRITSDEYYDAALYNVKRQKRNTSELRYRIHGNEQRKYIRSDDIFMLRKLYDSRINRETSDILKHNIDILSNASDLLKPYDAESIRVILPEAYSLAYDKIRQADITSPSDSDPLSLILSGKPYQSENSIKPESLIHRSTSGIYVRSKNELLIADALSYNGFRFFYEKALNLMVRSISETGREYFTKKTFYPDFTILIPESDGKSFDYVYWEHDGMMDITKYRDYNTSKIGIYADNNIYIPKNLIITMDSETVPFDTSLIQGIIDGLLKPRLIR